MDDRLERQFAFLNEADKLKSVLRGTTLCDGSRPENSGEHSWHIALYALVMAEHAIKPVNADRVIKMLLLHDLVEIDAGDNPIHGDHDPAEMEVIEQAAADRRLFRGGSSSDGTTSVTGFSYISGEICKYNNGVQTLSHPSGQQRSLQHQQQSSGCRVYHPHSLRRFRDS